MILLDQHEPPLRQGSSSFLDKLKNRSLLRGQQAVIDTLGLMARHLAPI